MRSLIQWLLAPYRPSPDRTDRSFGRHQSQSAIGSDPSRDGSDTSSQSAIYLPTWSNLPPPITSDVAEDHGMMGAPPVTGQKTGDLVSSATCPKNPWPLLNLKMRLMVPVGVA